MSDLPTAQHKADPGFKLGVSLGSLVQLIHLLPLLTTTITDLKKNLLSQTHKNTFNKYVAVVIGDLRVDEENSHSNLNR